ncbi:MazG-like family protein [Peptococcaceae bacterium CEB3]|nr:MazG-like family protein [Peptococcaceae bacterium CEB3]
MAVESVEVDVVKGMKAIDELKVELLKALWQLQQGALAGSEAETLEALSDLVGLSYLLTRRLGYDFARLDRVLLQRLEAWRKTDKAEFEERWGDVSLLLDYLAPEE